MPTTVPIFAPKPALVPGQKVIRLTPSSTGRQIFPNILGVMGGLNPTLHNNPVSWTMLDNIPIQWTNGLWSALAADDQEYTWDFYPRPVQEDEDDD